ncbi:MAG: nitroreductase, partial [Clostridiales bacterium]|nr:nitroreductase [Clostridiales bacterium]
IGEEEIFPIITPYGYAAPKKHIKETMMRKLIQADQRKEWNYLFFKNNFETDLSKKDAKDLSFPLEMVRLGPSASNKQPWRILVTEEACHFYEYKEPKYSDRFDYDIQRIDMGISAAHFDFSVKEKGIEGYFISEDKLDIKLPENVEYVFSWRRK